MQKLMHAAHTHEYFEYKHSEAIYEYKEKALRNPHNFKSFQHLLARNVKLAPTERF